MSKQTPKQSRLSMWWNKSILPQQLVRDILLILLGICFSSVIEQNNSVQDFLFKYVPPEWRLPMGLIIILIIVIFIFACLHKLENKSTKANDINTNVENIINELDKLNTTKTSLTKLCNKLNELLDKKDNKT